MLVVETGTGAATSNSYISVIDAAAYHAARGNAFTGTDAVLEAALLKAATYLDGYYRARWRGFKVLPSTQAMEWPRYDVAPFMLSDVIPQRLKDAQCELALRALSGELAADATGNIKREKVDVLETEYFANSVPKQVYTVVDQLLSDYITPLGSGYVVRG